MSAIPLSHQIIELFQKHGALDYGERCTVLSHSIQAGWIAKEKGLDKELILAAFLHDIGHLSPLEEATAQYSEMGGYGIEAHDKWGEAYLQARGFSPRIIATVRNHVDAKRYLCHVDTDYHAQLSEASKQTLSYQGGPMNEVEALSFESDPFFEDSIVIRKIDEEAKIQDFEIGEEHWEYFRNLIEKVVS